MHHVVAFVGVSSSDKQAFLWVTAKMGHSLSLSTKSSRPVLTALFSSSSSVLFGKFPSASVIPNDFVLISEAGFDCFAPISNLF